MAEVLMCQLDIDWEDKPANLRRARALLENARPAAGSLVVLPEMFSTGFSMAVDRIAEGRGKLTETFLAETAEKMGVFMLGGVVNRKANGRGLNQCVVFDPGGKEIVRYSKIHPFTFGEESKHYTGGSKIVTFQWQGFTVAPFVCYDLRFPEVFRQAVRKGANLFTVIACWPTPRVDHWVTLLQARAIENQAYVVGVNRCGRDPKTEYPGRSLVVDPRGKVVVDAGTGESALSATLDLPMLLEYRKKFPALADIRPRLFTLHVAKKVSKPRRRRQR